VHSCRGVISVFLVALLCASLGKGTLLLVEVRSLDIVLFRNSIGISG
jgi:hypothetical protein